MNHNLSLEIVTPQRVLLETEAEYVTIPGEVGELGVLPGHIPLLTNLQSGVLSYMTGNEKKKLAVHYGYAEVCGDKITVLARIAELADEIDTERARIALQTAESELAKAITEVDKLDLVDSLQKDIEKSITRQNVTQ